MEIRLENESIAKAISASYGFTDATGDVQLRPLAEDPRRIEPNTVTLMITQEPASNKVTVSIILLDADTGIELSRLDDIEMAFAI